MILRPCSTALAAAFAAGYLPAPAQMADLFTINLVSGTIYRFTSYSQSLLFSGNTFLAIPLPILNRDQWNVTNTMEIPQLTVEIYDNTLAGFGGSPLSLRTQIHNGLFDGGTLSLERLFMPTPGDTVTYGTIPIFKGDIGAATLSAGKVTIKVRGKNSRLSVNAPINVYQPGCIHTFCDAGCTLSSATFTTTHAVASAPSASVIQVNTLPGAGQVKGGTLTMTSGTAAGQSANIIDANLSTFFLTLSRPFYSTPVNGDTCTIFTGCDKTIATCNTTYANLVNFRGFPFIPPPNTTAPGQ